MADSAIDWEVFIVAKKLRLSRKRMLDTGMKSDIIFSRWYD